MSDLYAYWLEADDMNRFALYRRTKPRMGAVITFARTKWQVWYIEEKGDYCAARCEPLDTTPSWSAAGGRNF
jgi:hypothetical protein